MADEIEDLGDLSPEEEEQLRAALGYPKVEEKTGLFQFFNEVLKSKDTSKVSNLDDNELSAVRILKDTASYAEIMGVKGVGGFFSGEAETILATADSHKGFLIKAVGTQRRESRVRGEKLPKKGWFGKKEEVEE